ncbi:MAG: replicative DNA helicase [Bdellovibrionales bacterium RIFOXYD12_FULL_39_22]|nr:MAG: replicative DNA helicase [Bdellovibrionales bacterium RIFOXYB1_FULL_39_21]OFZ43394.1 MAG: replicative DNA helicase [Bdellovibrionales bacterium RIFOXYC12_FULL_39_17]OFZ47381.1 MAG: replicative DNA helicase [Bdellovibrionales bacterium RIFOXYC1_FULL_39_130]OFZ76261.1 MAG: replicative DNA helicase [Bdellovibrionales bacterium RIFOXYD1_FULL_39_84]OFZ94299.1 MAG: replicative DNA helicase [Bdellovibrionales bacterium RIFOXYD12_FULL_39_22]HLE12097.1 replicative DNA helicase [Bacteriovoracace
MSNHAPLPKDLPHDLLAEKSLLSCLIIDGLNFDEISDLCMSREDFFNPQYGMIFDAIKDLYMTRAPIDYVTIGSKLASMGQLEIIGGQPFILEVAEEQVSSANIYHYAKIVKDKSSMRNIVRTATKIAELGKSYPGEIQDFVSEVESSFFKLTNDAKFGGLVKLNTFLKQNLKDLEDTSRKPGEISGFSSGYTKLDELLLGMQPGQLIICAGRPASGKTALGLNIAVNVSISTGFPVAIFSLEMLAPELSLRLLASTSRVDSKRMKRKDFLDTDLSKIGHAVTELSRTPIFINDSSVVTIFDIQSQCRKIKSEQGLGLVVIDYLQLMKAHSNNPSREQQISEISRGLKGMAKELECPVLALSQLNRSVEARPNKRPNVSDLRESGSIEQDADIVMMIYRDEMYNPETKEPGIAEVIVGKNRSGETGTVKLKWIGEYTRFETLTYEPAPYSS